MMAAPVPRMQSPPPMSFSPAHLHDMLETLTRQCGVPGASLAVWLSGALAEAALGDDLETQVPVTSDTLFQIGSITKLYTSALCLQLVEEGKLALDAPVRATLPDFRVADEAVAAEVTLRDLLSHSSGIEGDWFRDAGRGEDRIEKFVAMMAALGQVHGRGEMFSYCNTGFVAMRPHDRGGGHPHLGQGGARPHRQTAGHARLDDDRLALSRRCAHTGPSIVISASLRALATPNPARAGYRAHLLQAMARDVVDGLRARWRGPRSRCGRRLRRARLSSVATDVGSAARAA